MLQDSHEVVILGSSDPEVGVDDGRLAHCLAAHILLAVLVPEGTVNLKPSAGGRGVQAGDRGGIIVLVGASGQGTGCGSEKRQW